MKDQITHIQEIKDRINQFVKERNWTEAYSPKNLSMSIAIEAAELMENFQWLTTEEASSIRENEAKFQHLKDELADVMIYCFSMANQLDIDVATIIEEKTKKNGRKYPVEKAKENRLGSHQEG